MRIHDDWTQSPQGVLTNCVMACFTFYVYFAKIKHYQQGQGFKNHSQKMGRDNDHVGLTAQGQ